MFLVLIVKMVSFGGFEFGPKLDFWVFRAVPEGGGAFAQATIRGYQVWALQADAGAFSRSFIIIIYIFLYT